MREALLMVPKTTNDGEPLDGLLDSVLATACHVFGGATVSDGLGCWIDDTGKLYREPVWQVAMAGQASDALQRMELIGLAHRVLVQGAQLAVYLRDLNGTVSILSAACIEDAAKLQDAA